MIYMKLQLKHVYKICIVYWFEANDTERENYAFCFYYKK
jgi:hypothetical protein